MTLHPSTVQQLLTHRIQGLGAQDRTQQRAQRLVLVKIRNGKSVRMALNETTAFVARETDK